MYFLLIAACLLTTIQVNGYRTTFFFDEAAYNPCGTKPNVFYYPDPTNNQNYYQCDESGIAYLRSCGTLVWDDLRVACNWPSAAAPPPARINPTVTIPYIPWLPGSTPSWSTATSSSPRTESTWPTPALTWPTTKPTWPTPALTWPTTKPTWPTPALTWPTTQSSSTTDASLPSLCKPTNPCGEHGQCLESPSTVSSSARRFACICSDNWFGRFCDKHLDELTTPPSVISDQSKNISETADTFSLPVKTEKDSKLVFFGLKAGDLPKELHSKKKRQSNRI